MTLAPSFVGSAWGRHGRRAIAAGLCLWGAASPLQAQTQGTVTSPAARAASAAGGNAPAATGPSAGARFVEACQQAIERGQVGAGCQGPLYASEIARLKEDALRSNNPNLLTLLGDAYQSNRSGISDIGQAYRWYLLGAVRGDARAMQRLSDLYRHGRGAPVDPVKALGYARLAQKMAVPGSASAQQATQAIDSLGRDMAGEELGLAERFAAELEAGLHAQGGGAGTSPGVSGAMGTPPAPPLNSARLPGLGAVGHAAPAGAGAELAMPQLSSPAGLPLTPAPLGGLPGVPRSPPATLPVTPPVAP